MNRHFVMAMMVAIVHTLSLQSQDVRIPDQNFLIALIEIGVDANHNGSISQAEAENVTDLDIQMKSIGDMTGIEAFSNLENLECQMNQLDSLNLSYNTAIKYVNVDLNVLTYLNVSNNLALISLICSNNRLDTLDVSSNLALKTLVLISNKVGSLDVSNLPALEHLECSSNNMTSLDVSNDTSLNMLNCMNNELTNLNLTTCPSLTYIQLNDMPSLQQVCVWITPFPPEGVTLKKTSSPNITFKDCLPPMVSTPMDTLFNIDSALVVSNEDVIIYLVPDSIEKEIGEIRAATIDSVATKADSVASVSLTGIQKGQYQIYSRDLAGNLSEPDSFIFLGVNLDLYPPILQAQDTLYQPDSLDVTCSEDGVIYLVPEGTGKTLSLILGSVIDSMAIEEGIPAKIPIFDLNNGVYWLYARDTVDNISDHLEFRIMGVGLGSLNAADQFRLYPNPVKDILTIESSTIGRAPYQLMDLSGAVFAKGIIDESPFQIDLTRYPQGIYIFRVDYQITYKIIKQ